VRIDQLRQNYEIEIRWRAFPLHPETPEQGTLLTDLFAGRSPADIESMKQRLKGVADEVGLPMGERKYTYNSRLAQELAKWAESEEKGDQFHEAVFRTYYVDGKNIGSVDVLVDLAKAINLPEQKARSVLKSRTYRQAVDSDWARCRDLNVTAVPTFVVSDQRVVGAQPYAVLEQFVKSQGAKKLENTSL
jgi:predicted DsbA family dithiol-disulfide isomerase